MTLQDIEARLAELEKSIAPLMEERSQLKQARLACLSPFKVGDSIRWEGGRYQGRVVDILSWLDSPMWLVRIIRRDGTDGTERKVYPYQQPEISAPRASGVPQ